MISIVCVCINSIIPSPFLPNFQYCIQKKVGRPRDKATYTYIIDPT